MKRYFLVCYRGQSYTGNEYFMGLLPVAQHDGKYINRDIVIDEIIGLHPSGKRQSIMFTNIIELSEMDFYEFNK